MSNNKTTMIQFNLSKSTVINKDFATYSDFENLIEEGEGFATLQDEFMILNCEGFEVVVNYRVDITGHTYFDKGDYFTPSFTEVEIDTIKITITSITVDEYEVDLTQELISVFKKIVKNIIK